MNQRQPNSKHPARRKCGFVSWFMGATAAFQRPGGVRCAGHTGRRMCCIQSGRTDLAGEWPVEPLALGRGGVHTRIRKGRRMDSLFFCRHLTQELFQNLIYVSPSLSHPQGSLDRSKAGLPRSVRHGESLPLASSPCLMHCSEDRLGGGEGPRSRALRCPGSKQHPVSLAGQRALPASIKPVFPPASKLQ